MHSISLSTLGPGTAHPGTRAVRSASYAALAALAASTVRTQPAPQAIGASAAEQLPACLPHAPLDAIPIMQNLLTPALPWQVGAKLGKGVKAWLDDEIEDGAKVQRRKGKEKQTKRVRWFVGCHFKHRLFDYTGMVVGWTVSAAIGYGTYSRLSISCSRNVKRAKIGSGRWV